MAGTRKTATDKGVEGEAKVRSLLESIHAEVPLSSKLFHDLTIYREDGATTQIDHVLVMVNAILVIETKNYSGWIFGSESEPRWTVTYPDGQKHPMQNPLFQNHMHAEAIANAVEQKVPIYSMVVFVGSAELKTPMGKQVVHLDQLEMVVRRVTGEAPASATSLEYLTGKIKAMRASAEDELLHNERLRLRHNKKTAAPKPAPRQTQPRPQPEFEPFEGMPAPTKPVKPPSNQRASKPTQQLVNIALILSCLLIIAVLAGVLISTALSFPTDEERIAEREAERIADIEEELGPSNTETVEIICNGECGPQSSVNPWAPAPGSELLIRYTGEGIVLAEIDGISYQFTRTRSHTMRWPGGPFSLSVDEPPPGISEFSVMWNG